MSDNGTCENCLFASLNHPCTTEHIEGDGDCWVSKAEGFPWWRVLLLAIPRTFEEYRGPPYYDDNDIEPLEKEGR